MDVDTTSAKWAHHEILERVGSGEIDILLGTQMIAKGLDFPNVTLVGVINADVAMNLPDFRASERTFQLLTQVAGRAGRGPKGGLVSSRPRCPPLRHPRAVDHDYETFAERELTRSAAPLYPPHTRLCNIVVSGTDETAVEDAARAAADWVAALSYSTARPRRHPHRTRAVRHRPHPRSLALALPAAQPLGARPRRRLPPAHANVFRLYGGDASHGPDEFHVVRLVRVVAGKHRDFLRQVAALAVVAGGARGHDVAPHVLAAPRHGNHVVPRQELTPAQCRTVPAAV
jgi:hypothetical protein